MRWVWPLLCTLVLHAGEAGLVVTAAGKAIAGPLTIAVSGVTVGGATLPWSEVLACAQPRAPARAINGGVLTRQGELLRGLAVDTAQGSLRWTSDRCGPRNQPLDTIAAVILGTLPVEALPGLLAGEAGALLLNGERIAGKLSYINAEAIGLDTGKRVAVMPRGRVVAVLVQQVEMPPTKPRTWLQLITGDRVLVGGAFAALPEAVIASWSDGPATRALVGTAPLRALATDRIGAALPCEPGRGFPLLSGGLATASGVVLPARGEIAWACTGFARLAAWAACPVGDEATIASVVVDGAVAWEQTLQPGAPAVAVVVPLRGAAEVALRSAPGADGETASRQVVWGMPTLSR